MNRHIGFEGTRTHVIGNIFLKQQKGKPAKQVKQIYKQTN
jgi:hypothetical protein